MLSADESVYRHLLFMAVGWHGVCAILAMSVFMSVCCLPYWKIVCLSRNGFGSTCFYSCVSIYLFVSILLQLQQFYIAPLQGSLLWSTRCSPTSVKQCGLKIREK